MGRRRFRASGDPELPQSPTRIHFTIPWHPCAPHIILRPLPPTRRIIHGSILPHLGLVSAGDGLRPRFPPPPPPRLPADIHPRGVPVISSPSNRGLAAHHRPGDSQAWAKSRGWPQGERCVSPDIRVEKFPARLHEVRSVDPRGSFSRVFCCRIPGYASSAPAVRTSAKKARSLLIPVA